MSAFLRITTLLLSITAAGAVSAAAPTQVHTIVYRCQNGPGATQVFQSLPCARGSGQRRLELAHVQPEPVAAPRSRGKTKDAEPRSNRSRSRGGQNRASRSARSRKPDPPAQTEERPAFARKTRNARAQAMQSSCPPTREDSGPTGSSSVGTAWKRYQSLPSRTYLKNAGKWPAHCPD